MTRRKYLCPLCKTKSGVAIVYGYPSWELMEEAQRGEVALGGCVIMDGLEVQPRRHCNCCGYEWPRPERKKMTALEWAEYKVRQWKHSDGD